PGQQVRHQSEGHGRGHATVRSARTWQPEDYCVPAPARGQGEITVARGAALLFRVRTFFPPTTNDGSSDWRVGRSSERDVFSAERDRSPVAARPKYFSRRYASTFALRYSGRCDRGAGRAPAPAWEKVT